MKKITIFSLSIEKHNERVHDNETITRRYATSIDK